MMKILLIVEGGDDRELFEGLLRQFRLEAELFVVGTNLYSLYKKCKDEYFNCDVKDVLCELIKDDELKQRLKEEKFAFTYLVFDADLHNKPTHLREIEDVPIADRLKDNFPKLIEMAKYFTDETDPTIGRLYINYPMLESFRYCDHFDEDGYPADEVSIYDMHKFKQLASQKRLAGISREKYTRDNFSDLIRMNLRRLKSVSSECFENFPDYSMYLNISQAEYVAGQQYEMIQSFKKLYILNTSLFLILDYYGNQNGFYDTVITPNTP